MLLLQLKKLFYMKSFPPKTNMFYHKTIWIAFEVFSLWALSQLFLNNLVQNRVSFVVLKLTKTTAFSVTRTACTLNPRLSLHFHVPVRAQSFTQRELSRKNLFLKGLFRSWSGIKTKIINCSWMKSASYTAILFFTSQNPSSVIFDLFFFFPE